MAGYADTRELIINTLTGRPAGTEIQPEDHQAFALQIIDYVRSVELVAGNATPIGFADDDTVPVQPDNGQAVYLSQVGGGTTVVFTNFIDQNGNAISVTSDSSSVTLVNLLWNGQYWTKQETRIPFSQNAVDLNSEQTITAKKTFSAGINLNGTTISKVGSPVNADDAANKKYVDNTIKIVANVVQITYAELKSLRGARKLVPGTQYRITDYTCTTTQANTKSAGNRFDIIVTADDESTLNEEARAALHSGDEYFSGCSLNAWKIWYCLDNDTNRFAWADDSLIEGKPNGKGVIYRMIDEFNNDCPYDFKNIQFERYKIVQCPKCKTLVGKYAAKESNKYEIDKSHSIWAYTFTHIDDAGHIFDHSIVGATMPNNNGYYVGVYNNKISSVSSYLYPGSDKPSQFQYRLNNICFISDSVTSKGFSYGCYSNTFESNCHTMTFGTSCNSNAFGEYCYENTFGDAIWFQSIGKECNNNIFGNGHKYNTLGSSCSNNIFGTNYKYNTIGYNCYNNEFGDNYSHNSFGISNYALKLGNNLQSNTFLNYCSNIVFGSDSSATEKYSYYKNNFFGNNCKYILFKETEASTSYIQNYSFSQGLQGTSSAYLTIDGERSRSYETKAAKNSNGELKVYCEADLIL